MTTETTSPEGMPEDFGDAAVWLLRRHEWVRQQVQRVIPHWNPDEEDTTPLVDLAWAFWVMDEHDIALEQFKRAHYEPGPSASDEEWAAYQQKVPTLDLTGWLPEEASRIVSSINELRVMSTGERGVCRMLAALNERGTRFSVWDIPEKAAEGGPTSFYADYLRLLEWRLSPVRFHFHPTKADQRVHRIQAMIDSGEIQPNPVVEVNVPAQEG